MYAQQSLFWQGALNLAILLGKITEISEHSDSTTLTLR